VATYDAKSREVNRGCKFVPAAQESKLGGKNLDDDELTTLARRGSRPAFDSKVARFRPQLRPRPRYPITQRKSQDKLREGNYDAQGTFGAFVQSIISRIRALLAPLPIEDPQLRADAVEIIDGTATAAVQGDAALLGKLTRTIAAHYAGQAEGHVVAGGETYPKTWEEAKVQVPHLKKWSAAKAHNPSLTIIEHLCDTETGYGLWTLRAPGLPRNVLRDPDALDDAPAYRALYTWLDKKDPKTQQRINKIPPYMHLPTRSDIVDRIVDSADDESVRSARRFLRSHDRRRQEGRGERSP
jgi:hypothetical protein